MLLLSYVAAEQLITPMKAQPRVALTTHRCHPLLLIDLQEKTITDVFNKILCMFPVYKQ